MIICRGSLKKCRDGCADAFHNDLNMILNIISAPRAKYYYVADDDELHATESAPGTSDHRLLFRGTLTELRILARSSQTTLKLEAKLGNGS